MYYPPYNDLLFEIYHYITQSNIILLNKASKRMQLIDERIKRFYYFEGYRENNKININYILDVSCSANNIKLINWSIKRYNDNNQDPDKWNKPFIYACAGGNIKLIKWMIKNGANEYNCGLVTACIGNHYYIARMMIKLGATNLFEPRFYAYKTGNIKLINLLNDKINEGRSEYYQYNGKKRIYEILRGACEAENIKLAKWSIKNGADDFNTGLFYACHNNHKKLMRLMIKRGATECRHIACGNRSLKEHLKK